MIDKPDGEKSFTVRAWKAQQVLDGMSLSLEEGRVGSLFYETIAEIVVLVEDLMEEREQLMNEIDRLTP